MDRRHFLKYLNAGIGASLCPIFTFCDRAKEKPNILFIFADDQCFEALSAYGSEVKTLNLDILVRSGISFTNAYNQGAWHGAVCVASRTMLNTGRFLWNAKAIEPDLDKEVEQRRLWAQHLQSAGYDTYMSGKWHVKTDAQKVFMKTGSVRPGMPNQTDAGYNRPKNEKDYKAGWKPWDTQYEGYWKGGKHWSEVLGDEGVQFLEDASNKDNPFFMYLAFNAPHDPRQSPESYVDQYPLDEIDVPENFLPQYPYKDEIGCSEKLRDEKLAPFPRSEYAVKVNRQEYYAIITHMDDQIGRILDALEKSGKAKDTYIFFTADHGLAVGQHGLMGKQNMFEHSVKPPLIVKGPGIPKNKTNNALVYLQDIMPTTLEIAGIQKPEYIEFKSLLPLLSGKREKNYHAIYGGYMDLQRMVRRDNYKLIYYPKANKILLFDLAKDPHEMNDLSKDPTFAPVIKNLFQELNKLQVDLGDTLKLQL